MWPTLGAGRDRIPASDFLCSPSQPRREILGKFGASDVLPSAFLVYGRCWATHKSARKAYTLWAPMYTVKSSLPFTSDAKGQTLKLIRGKKPKPPPAPRC